MRVPEPGTASPTRRERVSGSGTASPTSGEHVRRTGMHPTHVGGARSEDRNGPHPPGWTAFDVREILSAIRRIAVTSLIVVAAACGRTVVVPRGAPAKVVTTASSVAGAPSSSSPRRGCPVSIPAPGTPCEPLGYPCVYGSETVHWLRAQVWCDAFSHKWHEPWRATSENLLADECPPSRDAAVGAKCDQRVGVCVYGDYVCGCGVANCSGGCEKPGTWVCPDPHESEPRCPIKAPGSDATCDTPGIVCSYYECGVGLTVICEATGEWRKGSAICEG